jgi:L-seryl-tRNA(Ser) seleniumtransferase
VILHTNLGRAPLSLDAIEAVREAAQDYSNLEFDLNTGKRGSRYDHAENLLSRLTGAEAALVVNNNASALLLILTALARRRRVLISRTQLIEIGGGFRIPEVMAQSGAILEEIGATNKVHLSDYQKAVDEKPIKMILRAHRSNFQITGFHSEPELNEIADLAYRTGILMVDDLGSGTLLDTKKYGLQHEMTVQESLKAGSDLVCFSGDKLLGGPQGGIIVGKKDLIKKLKKHPIARAVRADKMAYAGLSATLLHYLKGEAEAKVPVWQMISADLDTLKQKAENWQRELGFGEVIEGESTVGGGSLPGGTLPTYLLAISTQHPNKLVKKLLGLQIPIIARVEDDKVLFDPRTVLDVNQDSFLAQLKSI